MRILSMKKMNRQMSRCLRSIWWLDVSTQWLTLFPSYILREIARMITIKPGEDGNRLYTSVIRFLAGALIHSWVVIRQYRDNNNPSLSGGLNLQYKRTTSEDFITSAIIEDRIWEGMTKLGCQLITRSLFFCSCLSIDGLIGKECSIPSAFFLIRSSRS